jgi:hypothetical protein
MGSMLWITLCAVATVPRPCITLQPQGALALRCSHREVNRLVQWVMSLPRRPSPSASPSRKPESRRR